MGRRLEGGAIRPAVWLCAALGTLVAVGLIAMLATPSRLPRVPEAAATRADDLTARRVDPPAPAPLAAAIDRDFPQATAAAPEATTVRPVARLAGPASPQIAADPQVARDLLQGEFAAARAAERLRLDERLFPTAETEVDWRDLPEEDRRRQLSDELVAEYFSRSIEVEPQTPDGSSSAQVAARARENARQRLSQTTPALRLKLIERALHTLE